MLSSYSGARVTSYGPLFRCLVTSAPEDGDRMFLRNVGIDLQVYTALKPNTYIQSVDSTAVLIIATCFGPYWTILRLYQN
jgi:hypothetical protein